MIQCVYFSHHSLLLYEHKIFRGAFTGKRKEKNYLKLIIRQYFYSVFLTGNLFPIRADITSILQALVTTMAFKGQW